MKLNANSPEPMTP